MSNHTFRNIFILIGSGSDFCVRTFARVCAAWRRTWWRRRFSRRRRRRLSWRRRWLPWWRQLSRWRRVFAGRKRFSRRKLWRRQPVVWRRAFRGTELSRRIIRWRAARRVVRRNAARRIVWCATRWTISRASDQPAWRIRSASRQFDGDGPRALERIRRQPWRQLWSDAQC